MQRTLTRRMLSERYRRRGAVAISLCLMVGAANAQQSFSLGDIAEEGSTTNNSAMASENAMQELAKLDAQSTAPPALPSLPALFASALEHDADLSRQRFELAATREEVPMARSQLLPQLSANGSYLWQDSTNIQTSPDDFGLDQPAQRPGEIDETVWGVQLQQPLFSLERWRGVDVANAQVSAAELQLAVVERDLAIQVSEAYVQAYLASQRLGLLESQREALDLQVRQAQRAYDLGIGDRINLLEAQSRLDETISDAVQADNELNNALSTLERLTGTYPEFRQLAIGELSSVELARDWNDTEKWLARVGQNLDVLLAREQQRITEADTSTRRAGYYPELNLNLAYSDRQSDDALRESEDYRASVEVSVPIYRGGYTTANVRQGERRIDASQADLDNQRNLAVQEVRQRLRSLNGHVRRIQALNQAIESSQLFLDAAERGEQLGLRDLVDVLDARASLYDQRIQYVDTIGEYALDTLSLQSAVGHLSSQDLNDIMSLLLSLTDFPVTS